MPPHRFMRFNADRNLDKTARGLGGTPSVPVTSVGEENVTMEGDRWGEGAKAALLLHCL
jgi:hypothetical protein